MSSSSSPTPAFDVYLSFGGEDTRRSFVSHLYRSLNQNGIEAVSPILQMISHKTAIRASKIAIVVISEEYASSTRCLEELALILELQQKSFLKVIPVYYGIEFTDVRKQTGKIEQHFRETHPGSKIEKWTTALFDLGSIVGVQSHNWEDNEEELIEKITADIFYTLNDGLFGMKLHMQTLMELLELTYSNDKVREIGIYGSVGIGKTVLAKYVYRQISHYFDVHLLLKDVNNILQELQELQSQLVQPPDMTSISSLMGKRVLFLVDDVVTIEQIDIIRKHIQMFGFGSRVIVTCKDKHLLLACDIKHIYQLAPVTYSEALRHFSFRAFKQLRPPSGFEKLVDRAVRLAHGIPSMIDAIGSELCHTPKEDWEMVLSKYEQSYDVFLSFVGEDIRRTFVSHLRCSLVEKGFRIVESCNSHLNAIQSSEIALIVITKNYISSGCRFKELTEILECQRKGSLMVFPVYYAIEPTDVMGHQLGTHMGKSFEQPLNKLQRWSESLKELGSITGEHSNNWKDEAELIRKITDTIWNKLSVSRLSSLVGMHLHMERMYELLSLESELEQVREIGIFGTVGIGKTTLARYVYQQISPYFHTLFFLDTIGKIYQDHDSSNLQAELLWKHFQKSSKKYANVSKASLRKCKVLLFVDGVDRNEQVEDIEKLATWFGPGSRVIFICEDKHLLLALGVKHLYQVEPMAFPEAFRLFSIRAFKQFQPLNGFKRLSERAVKLADGLPLVIAAIGLELFGRPSEEWELVLSRYERASVEETKGIEKIDIPHGSNAIRRAMLQNLEASDEGTLRTGKSSSSGVSDVSKVCGRSKEEWKLALSKYEQSSDVETKISSFGVTDDENMSLVGNTTTFNFVGMDCHIQAVCGGLMELESDNKTRIVGVWGVGGIGKTTLARLVYEETMHHFQTHVFLENGGKIYQDHGSSRLEEELMWVYIQRSPKNVSDVTKARLKNRKVLLVVDGVHNNEQMENVWKVSTWFGAGSRVIITTRDEYLLVNNGVRHTYEVKCLKVHEALQIFYQLAFKQQTPSIRFKQLSVRAVQLAGRIPLALEVLASFLHGKTENDWESILQKLERRQDNDTVEITKTSSDVEVSSEEEEDDEESDKTGDVNETVGLTLSPPLKPSLLWVFAFIACTAYIIYGVYKLFRR